MPQVLEDYLYVSRKRRDSRLALARLQGHLVDELITAEASIKYYRDEKSKLEKSCDGNPNDSPQDSVKQNLKLVSRDLFLWRAFANVIRAIADGVAWRALGFDRAVLCALCQNRGSQHITSPGTAEELREWSRQFDHGTGIAILNSLTNWLTYGDVTVVQDEGSVQIVEVKASKTTSNRVVRQKQRMSELVTFLSSGKGDLDGKTLEIRTLDIVPETGLDALERLLRQTDNPPGHAAVRLSNSVYIECVDFRVIGDDVNSDIHKLRDSLIADWQEKRDDIHASESLNCLGFSPNMAPFSVFPFEPALCIDLLTGAKAYMVLLNVTAVAREFQYRHWQVVSTPKRSLRPASSTKTL